MLNPELRAVPQAVSLELSMTQQSTKKWGLAALKKKQLKQCDKPGANREAKHREQERVTEVDLEVEAGSGTKSMPALQCSCGIGHESQQWREGNVFGYGGGGKKGTIFCRWCQEQQFQQRQGGQRSSSKFPILQCTLPLLEKWQQVKIQYNSWTKNRWTKN